MISPSRCVRPKNAGSNPSGSRSTARADTYALSARSAAGTLASSSSGLNIVTLSRPASRLAQNSSVVSAPGRRLARPISAIGSDCTTAFGAVVSIADVRLTGAWGSSDAARWAADALVNSAAADTRRPSARSMVSAACTASSESPPSSKKLSSRPTRSICSIVANASQHATSTPPTGAAYSTDNAGRDWSGAGRAA